MRGWVVAVLAVLALPPAQARGVTADADSPAVLAATRASAVVVSSRIAGDWQAIGAGVIVDVTPFGIRVVTARHVVSHGDVTVWLERRPYAAEIVRTFAHRDLAVVDALVPPAALVRLRPATLGVATEAGAPLHIWGEDEGGPRLATGHVTALAMPSIDDRSAPPLLALACDTCREGDSGGGIFDARGVLVGILVARYRTSSDVTVALVAETVGVVAP